MIVDLGPVIPAILVALTGFVILLSGAFGGAGLQACRNLATAGLGLALAYVLSNPGTGALGGTVLSEAYGAFVQAALLIIGLLSVWLSSERLEEDKVKPHEFFTLICFSMVGMLGLATAAEAISLFVALEIMSVALYALCAMPRTGVRRQEAGLKYFITGSFSSAFLLFGIALLYGASGSTTLAIMARSLSGGDLLALAGAAFVFVGFLFKVGAAPFHMWAPDVYQGAVTSVTAFMAAGVKIAAFGALGRIVAGPLLALSPAWAGGVALVAAFTMVVGNLGALAQTDLKRLLAFSSVAHAGYMLSGIVAMGGQTEPGLEALLFYVATYAITNLGAFGILIALRRNGHEPVTVADLAGLSGRNPLIAAFLTIFLISLTGIPVSVGFVGKFQLFRAAVASGYSGLAVVGVLMSVVSAFYYLRIVVGMYMEEAAPDVAFDPAPVTVRSIVALCAGLTFGLGIFPGWLLAAARAAAESLR